MSKQGVLDYSDPNRYVVRRIDDRRVLDGKSFYLVQWDINGSRSWEPEEHLDDCEDLLRMFHARVAWNNAFIQRVNITILSA